MGSWWWWTAAADPWTPGSVGGGTCGGSSGDRDSGPQHVPRPLLRPRLTGLQISLGPPPPSVPPSLSTLPFTPPFPLSLSSLTICSFLPFSHFSLSFFPPSLLSLFFFFFFFTLYFISSIIPSFFPSFFPSFLSSLPFPPSPSPSLTCHSRCGDVTTRWWNVHINTRCLASRPMASGDTIPEPIACYSPGSGPIMS